MWLSVCKYLFLFVVGGGGYYSIEMFTRNYSHWSMFVLGGLCFVGCGLLDEDRKYAMPFYQQMIVAALLITLLEYLTGIWVNLVMGWNVWDYSRLPFNLYGQVCLRFTLIWFVLGGAAMIAEDYLRYWLYAEEKPGRKRRRLSKYSL